MKVDIFIPCFIDQVYPETGMNMVKILEKCGCEVAYNPEQTCCGQAAFTSGYNDEAKEVGGRPGHHCAGLADLRSRRLERLRRGLPGFSDKSGSSREGCLAQSFLSPLRELLPAAGGSSA